MKVAGAVAVLSLAALVSGCGELSTDGRPTGVATATPSSAAPAPTAGLTEEPGTDPVPEHRAFAAGETIAADGKAGIFFLDPVTGAAEGWVVPADPTGYLPFSFTVGGVSADGNSVLYTCRESGTSGLSPCGDRAQEVWYLLDTRSGSRTKLDAFTGDFVSISPHGKTLIGRTPQGIALADVATPAVARPLALPASASGDGAYLGADWSPDDERLVLAAGATGRAAFLVNVTDGRVTELGETAGGVRWSPDGAQFTVGRPVDKESSRLVVFDRNGEEIWSKPIAASGAYGVWSADRAFMYAQEQERPATSDGFGPLDRVIVLDTDTGATAYRVRGAFCPLGWAGGSHKLLALTYGAGVAVADLDARSIDLLDQYVIPVPFDGALTIVFTGDDFYSYDLSTGSRKLIARTTVSPAWDTAHESLFAGERLVFTSLHGGHGGCGEGAGPLDPPQPELLPGPFPDDAPVTRGGVH